MSCEGLCVYTGTHAQTNHLRASCPDPSSGGHYDLWFVSPSLEFLVPCTPLNVNVVEVS